MISRRYAKALLSLALKYDIGLPVKEDMKGVLHILKTRENKEYLNDRMVSDEHKLGVFEGCQDITKCTIKLVIRNKRERYLPLIAHEYIRLLNNALGLEDVEIFTSETMAEHNKVTLEKGIGKMLSRKILPKYVIDKSIIGGVAVKYGNKMIDGTVSGVLLKLMEDLTRI